MNQIFNFTKLIIITLVLLVGIGSVSVLAQSLYVDRKSKQLYVLDKNGHVLLQDIVGIGKGGLRKKTSMDDLVTPTGKFSVDLILYKDKRFDAVSPKNIKRYNRTKFSQWLSSQDGLAKLFKNMNEKDYDGDGKPDHAYGDGYMGLSSLSGAVTGRKMSEYKGIPYWSSIALHGTSDPSSIGADKSGGCLHLTKETVSKLITNRLVKIGTLVTVADQPPLHK